MLKMRLFIPIPVLLLLLLMGGLSSDCERQEENIEVEDGQVLDIRVGLSLQSSLAQGLSFENVKVQAGSLEEPAWYPGKDIKYKTGDRCLLVLGDIVNDTSDNLTLFASAQGYNGDWELVAWTLSTGSIIGNVMYTLPQKSRTSFEIILSWAEDVQFIEISPTSFSVSPYDMTPE